MGTSVRAPVEVQFRATGVDAVRSGMRVVRNEAKSASSEAGQVGENFNKGSSNIATGARGAATALSMVAANGKAGQDQIRQLITTGADMALVFGVGGPVIAAIGLIGLTIYNVFSRAKQQIDDVNKALVEGVQGARRAHSLDAAQREVISLYSGDPQAFKGEPGHEKETQAQFLARSKGLDGLTQRKAQLEAEIAENSAIVTRINLLSRVNEQNFWDRKNAEDRRADQVKELELVKQQYDIYHKQYSLAKGGTGGLNDQIKRAVSETQSSIAQMAREKAPGERDRRAALLLEYGAAGALNTERIKEARELLAQYREELTRPLDASRVDQIKKQMESLSRLPGIAAQNTLIGTIHNPGLDRMFGQEGYLQAMFPTTVQNDPGGVPRVSDFLPPNTTAQLIKQFADQVQTPLETAIRSGMADTIGSAITDGITAGFESHSIGAGFKAAGKAILSGIGGILEQMGGVWIKYGILMSSLGQALWNPFTSGPAAIGIGIALTALGAALGAVSHGGGGGSSGGGSYGSSSLPAIVNTAYLNPSTGMSSTSKASTITPPKAVTQNVWVIGADPKAWRQVQEQLDANGRRG